MKTKFDRFCLSKNFLGQTSYLAKNNEQSLNRDNNLDDYAA